MGRLLVLIGCALAVWAGAAGGEERAAPVDEITVRAERLDERLFEVPAAVSVIDWEHKGRGQAGLTLAEPLAAVPGVFTQSRDNFAQDLRISIRGFGARANFGVRGVKLLIDGIPATLPDGQGQIDGIPLASVGRIEVVRGPSSSLYGGAAGGIVRVESAPIAALSSCEARAVAGSHGFRGYDLMGSGRRGSGGLQIALSHRELDGYRNHARMQSSIARARLEWRRSDAAELSLTTSFAYEPIAQDPGGLKTGEVAFDRRAAAPNNLVYDAGERVRQVRSGLRYRRALGAHGELTASGHFSWRGFANRLPFRAGGSVAFDRLFGGAGLLYEHSGRLFGLTSRALVGVEVDSQRDDRTRHDNLQGLRGPKTLDQRERVTALRLFASEQLALRDDLALHFSLGWDRLFYRVDDHFLADGRDDSGARDFGEWSPAAALRWGPRPGLSLYARVSTSFEPPTTTELADPSGAGGFNAGVDPQSALGLEVGARGLLPARLRYELAVYHVRSSDELVPFEIAGQPGRSYFENAGRSTRTGFEVALGTQPLEGLTFALAYTFSRARFDDFTSKDGVFDGHRLPGVPDHSVYAKLAYEHHSGFWGRFELRYADAFFADNANSARSQAYVIADLRFGWERRFGGLRVAPYLAADNLFGERYTDHVRLNARYGRFFEPAPEREWRGGLELRYSL